MYKFNFYHTRPENFFRNDKGELTKGLVGYLRGDFGRDGKEFHHTWFNNNEKLNNSNFKEAMQICILEEVNAVVSKPCLEVLLNITILSLYV